MAKSLWLLFFTVLLFTSCTCDSNEEIDEELPEKWKAAIRRVMATFLANPNDEIYEIVETQAKEMKCYAEELFKDRKVDEDVFFENVMDKVGDLMAHRKKSRVPLKHKIGAVVLSEIMDNVDGFEVRKVPKRIMERLKVFSEKLAKICEQDEKCQKVVK